MNCMCEGYIILLEFPLLVLGSFTITDTALFLNGLDFNIQVSFFFTLHQLSL